MYLVTFGELDTVLREGSQLAGQEQSGSLRRTITAVWRRVS